MKENTVTKLIDALEARTHFGEVMEQAEKGNARFLVSRRGKPKVMILSVADYLKNVVKEDAILAEIQLTAKQLGLDKMTEDEIEAEIAASRQDRRKDKKASTRSR
jgi:prevent-host-death family protein